MKPSYHITAPKRGYDGRIFAFGVSNWSIKDRHGFLLERQRETVLPSLSAAKEWAKRHHLVVEIDSKWGDAK